MMIDFMKNCENNYTRICEKYIDDPNEYNQELSSNSKAFTKLLAKYRLYLEEDVLKNRDLIIELLEFRLRLCTIRCKIVTINQHDSSKQAKHLKIQAFLSRCIYDLHELNHKIVDKLEKLVYYNNCISNISN